MGRERDDMTQAKKVKGAALLGILVAVAGFIAKVAKDVPDTKKLTELNCELTALNSKFIKSKADKERIKELKTQIAKYTADE